MIDELTDLPPAPEEPKQLTPEQALSMLDDDFETIPPIPYQPSLTVWALSPVELSGGMGVIVTVANQGFPNGIPFLLERDRALKFCSQIKKIVTGGPKSDLTVAKSKLILPGQ